VRRQRLGIQPADHVIEILIGEGYFDLRFEGGLAPVVYAVSVHVHLQIAGWFWVLRHLVLVARKDNDFQISDIP
jgi:hypothetical protein